MFATLQVGNALYPTAYLALQGTGALATCSYFDDVTQVAVDPTAVTATMTAPDGTTTALTVTRLAQGSYQAAPAFAELGTSAVTFSATNSVAGLNTPIVIQQSVVTSPAYTSSVTPIDPWVFVTA